MEGKRVVSYIIKDLHNPNKRKKNFNKLKHLKCAIAFKQERLEATLTVFCQIGWIKILSHFPHWGPAGHSNI